ncbi:MULTISPECIES: LysR family transcriptional regulator [Thalassotalea]|uniref:LysR family transcriptional regulator n=1 Tax=Thalassotalea castellviae TaxID=3075612 RepID=A0ABU3A048_9GAMM|nr:LysR family transcriptional regulator [Thalassotalea sp. W431]MDT0602927.1 LysR family transcriptional regulator [Thalassotalea sp. W431]
MDLKHLNYFITVYEQKSFSAAAKHCFIAQPSISAAIAQLELELQQALFTRHARGVTPTDQGKKLYPLAKQLIGKADAIKQTFLSQGIHQSFRLGVTKGLGVKRMSALLNDFTSAEPSMELTLVPQHENSDARIIIKEELKDEEKYHLIWQEDYLLVLPMNHPLSLKDEIRLSDLDGLAFIQRSPCNAWQMLNDTLTLSGIQLDIRAKIQTIDYALGLVRAGLGCALVPAHPEIIENTDLTFKAINKLKLTREIVLAYQHPSPLLNTLRQQVKLISES